MGKRKKGKREKRGKMKNDKLLSNEIWIRSKNLRSQKEKGENLERRKFKNGDRKYKCK